MGVELQSSRGGRRGRATPSMNVTPLVDVVLVLLIIFMVITPMLSKQFSIKVPQKSDAAAPPSDTPPDVLVVTVTAANAIEINKQPVTREAFAERLAGALAMRTDRTVFFDAADTVPYEFAASLMDEARGKGAANIAVLTNEAHEALH